MPEKWTGKVVGRMHVEGIKYAEVAEEMGVTLPYVSMLLNGKRKVAGARERIENAVEAISARKKGK